MGILPLLLTLAMSQKALFLTAAHGDYKLSERPIPTPAPDQILVQVKSLSLNPVEWKIVDFNYFVKEYPAVLGSDASGDIVEVGEAVQGFSKNDRV